MRRFTKASVFLLALPMALVAGRLVLAQDAPSEIITNVRVLRPDGTPLAYARVQCNFLGDLFPGGAPRPGKGLRTHGIDSAETNADGFIRQRHDFKLGRYAVFVRLPEWGYAFVPRAEVRNMATMAADEAPIIDMQLQPGETLRVTAREEVALPGNRRRVMAMPVGGASVELSLALDAPQPPDMNQTAQNAAVPGGAPATNMERHELNWSGFNGDDNVTRDGDGLKEFPNLPPGRYEVTLRSTKDYPVTTVPVTIEEAGPYNLPVNMARRRLTSLRLAFQDAAGAPLKNTQVSLRFAAAEAEVARQLGKDYDTRDLLERRLRTDATGEGVVYPLPTGRWRVTAGWGMSELQIEDSIVEAPPEGGEAVLLVHRLAPNPGVAEAAVQTVVSPLREDEFISNVRVLLPNGAPAVGVRLTLNMEGRHSSGRSTGRSASSGTLVNDNGFLRFQKRDEGRHRILVRSAEFGMAMGEIEVGPNAPAVNLRLRPGGTLRVLAGETLTLPGRGRRTVQMPVGSAAVLMTLLPDKIEEDTTVGPSARPAPGSQLGGRFEIGFSFMGGMATHEEQRTRDGDGLMEMEHLPPGRYEVTVRAQPGYEPVTFETEIAPGEVSSHPVMVTSNPATSLQVRLLDDKDKPLRNSEVQVRFMVSSAPGSMPGGSIPMMGMGTRIARTNANGEFTLYPVTPGQRQISVSRKVLRQMQEPTPQGVQAVERMVEESLVNSNEVEIPLDGGAVTLVVRQRAAGQGAANGPGNNPPAERNGSGRRRVIGGGQRP